MRIALSALGIEKTELELIKLLHTKPDCGTKFADIIILIKKLKNLGAAEYEDKYNLFKIKKGDILLVEDLGIISQKTVDLIKNKVDINKLIEETEKE